MHTEVYTILKECRGFTGIYKDAKIFRKELRERFVLDDDEFDLQRYLGSLEDLLNAGSLSDANFALERIRFLGLRLRMQQYDEESDWFFVVDL